MSEQLTDTVALEKINRIVMDASSQANLLAVNTAIIAEKLESKEGITVIAKELQTLAEQLKIASEGLLVIINKP